MKTLISIAMAALVVPAIASAGRSGGGHGGGHGGGGHSHSNGGSRGRSTGHAHSSRHSHGCAEVSSVVGYQQCSRFGAWSSNLPALSVDLGIAAHRFVGQRVDETGTFMEDTTSFGYRFVSEPGSLVTTAVAPQLRVALQLQGPFYIGNELELGGVTSGPGVRAEIDGGQAGPVSATYAAVRGVAGLGVRMQPVVFSGELAGGMRLLAYKIKDEAASSFQSRGELQVRARLDLWLTPRMTVGALIGSSLLDRGDTMVALSIGGHLKTFGGER
jgi:hypothetical protein